MSFSSEDIRRLKLNSLIDAYMPGSDRQALRERQRRVNYLRKHPEKFDLTRRACETPEGEITVAQPQRPADSASDDEGSEGR